LRTDQLAEFLDKTAGWWSYTRSSSIQFRSLKNTFEGAAWHAHVHLVEQRAGANTAPGS